MKAAQAAGDIATLLNLLTASSSLTTSDFVQKTVGGLRFLYYLYLDKLHSRPRDMLDLIDGLLYLESASYIQEQEYAKLSRRMEKDRGHR